MASQLDVVDGIEIRAAKREDCAALLQLVKESAEKIFPTIPERVNINEKEMEECGFGNDACYQCYVAVRRVAPPAGASQQIVGYVFYTYIMDPWLGRVVYVLDLYVAQESRRKSIGLALQKKVVKTALEKGGRKVQCEVMESRMSTINFCKENGGIDTTERDGWHLIYLFEENMQKFVNQA